MPWQFSCNHRVIMQDKMTQKTGFVVVVFRKNNEKRIRGVTRWVTRGNLDEFKIK